MKTILLAILIGFASCSSENDPEPQVSCDQLVSEIDQVSKQLDTHYAKGSQGNQSSWEKELTRLTNLKSSKISEAKKRLCQ